MCNRFYSSRGDTCFEKTNSDIRIDFAVSTFSSAFPAFPPTYSNFVPDEISVFGEDGGGARINRRYYSCNWQSRRNFWLV